MERSKVKGKEDKSRANGKQLSVGDTGVEDLEKKRGREGQDWYGLRATSTFKKRVGDMPEKVFVFLFIYRFRPRLLNEKDLHLSSQSAFSLLFSPLTIPSTISLYPKEQ